MAKSEGARAPGWYPVDPNEASGAVRYWDGNGWQERPAVVPPSTDVVEAGRRTHLDEKIRATGARLGEGIPFHELYMRRRSTKKADWFGYDQ